MTTKFCIVDLGRATKVTQASFIGKVPEANNPMLYYQG